MNAIQNSIIFIGMTCSGKSTLATELSNVISFKKASFGGYLFSYAKENGIDTKKDSLQIIGQNFIENDYKQFLSAVLEFSTPGENVIFEGVRHIVIAEEIKRLGKKTIFFFIDTPFEIRFERFNLRETEKITVEQFLELDNHPVEKEIEILKKSCDVVLDGCKEVAALLADVLTYVKSNIIVNQVKDLNL